MNTRELFSMVYYDGVYESALCKRSSRAGRLLAIGGERCNGGVCNTVSTISTYSADTIMWTNLTFELPPALSMNYTNDPNSASWHLVVASLQALVPVRNSGLSVGWSVGRLRKY